MSFEGRFKIWLDVLGLVKLTAGEEEGGVVAVVKAMFKGESGVGRQEELIKGILCPWLAEAVHDWHLRNWTEEGVGEDKEKERRRKDCAKLLELRGLDLSLSLFIPLQQQGARD